MRQQPRNTQHPRRTLEPGDVVEWSSELERSWRGRGSVVEKVPDGWLVDFIYGRQIVRRRDLRLVERDNKPIDNRRHPKS